jgi:hypothetical protein
MKWHSSSLSPTMQSKPSGRRKILTDDIYIMIVEFVAHRLSAGRPRTYEEILDQIECQFNTVIQAATLRAMLKRKADVKTVIPNPIQGEQAEVTVVYEPCRCDR